jgi:ATP-dependent Lon protease
MPVLTDLPLFPLGLVLYPNERLPLHIFEPRYKEMIRYCLDEDAPFGIALFNDGKLADMGCTARIAEVVTRYEDGRLDIAVRGEVRFRVLQLAQERAYLTAVVETIEEPPEQPKKALKERAITQHMKLLELAGRTVRPSLYQDVLEILTENDRIAYLVSHFEALIPRVEEMEDVRRRVQSNGHFKDFPPERSG